MSRSNKISPTALAARQRALQPTPVTWGYSNRRSRWQELNRALIQGGTQLRCGARLDKHAKF